MENYFYSPAERLIDEKGFCVKYSSLFGRVLLLLIREHCLAKIDLESLVVLLKPATN